jgi:hypothetical protein
MREKLMRMATGEDKTIPQTRYDAFHSEEKKPQVPPLRYPWGGKSTSTGSISGRGALHLRERPPFAVRHRLAQLGAVQHPGCLP